MNIRARKALGGLGILVFLFLYVVLVVTVAGYLPNNKAIQMVYFIVAGVAWGAPLIPLLTWMGKGR